MSYLPPSLSMHRFFSSARGGSPETFFGFTLLQYIRPLFSQSLVLKGFSESAASIEPALGNLAALQTPARQHFPNLTHCRTSTKHAALTLHAQR